jgi:hypothetical protein
MSGRWFRGQNCSIDLEMTVQKIKEQVALLKVFTAPRKNICIPPIQAEIEKYHETFSDSCHQRMFGTHHWSSFWRGSRVGGGRLYRTSASAVAAVMPRYLLSRFTNVPQ